MSKLEDKINQNVDKEKLERLKKGLNEVKEAQKKTAQKQEKEIQKNYIIQIRRNQLGILVSRKKMNEKQEETE